MRVLGIDPGSNVTGFGVVDKKGNSYSHVASGDIKLKKSQGLPDKLLTISNSIKELIKEYKPEAVAVEAIFFAENAKSAIVLGHARGAVLLSAASLGLEVFEYSPTNIKQSVTGHGRSGKAEMQKMMGLLLGKEHIKSADSADALSVAICHINSHGLNKRVALK